MPLYLRYFLSHLLLNLSIGLSLASAADIRWIGPSGGPSGNWGEPTNWDSGTVPGPNDRAILTDGSYTVTLDVSAIIAGIVIGDRGATVGAQTLRILVDRTLTVIASSELNGSATLTIEGSGIFNNDGGMQWAGGIINGPGVLNNNGDWLIAAGGFQVLTNGAIFNNTAQITIMSTDFRGGGGSVLNNFFGASVIVEDGTVARFAFVSGPRLVLVNQGVLTKKPGPGLATWGVGFNLEGGLVDVPQGTLALSGGGISNGGTIDVGPGASLDFTGDLHSFAGTYSGTTDGLITLDHSIDPSGATFDFQGNGFNWFAGTLTGPGTLFNTGTLHILPGAFQIMANSAAIDNSGTMHFASTDFRGGGGSILRNVQGGTFVLHDNAVGRFAFVPGPALRFVNQGMFIKPAGPGTATWALGFDQTGGTIDVQQGSVLLSGGGNSQGGTINVAPAAALDFRGQFHTFSGTYTGVTDGRVALFTNIDPKGATLNFQQGGFNWYSGTLRGPGTLTNSGNVNIMTGDFQVMENGASIDNAGTMNFISTDFRGGGGSVITNLLDGNFIFTDDAVGRFAFVSGPALTLINRGTVTKIKGPGLANWALGFNNEGGTVDVQDGTLLLSGGGISKDGNFSIGVPGTLDLSGTVHTFSGTFSGISDGRMVLNTSIDPAGATLDFSVGGLNWYGGRVTGPGTLTNNGTLNIIAGSSQEISNSALIENSGTINLSSTDLRGGGGSIITNLSTGSFIFKDDVLARFVFVSGPALTLVNEGAVMKDEGAGAANWDLPFNNEGGFIDVQTGSLNFSSGGTSTGGNIYVAPNAGLDFGGTTHSWSGTYTGATVGTVGLNTAIDSSGATFEFFEGGLNWYGGTLTGPGTLTNFGALNIIPGSSQTITDNATIENHGEIHLRSANLRGGGGSVINNRIGASFFVNTDASALFAFVSGPALAFNNEGRFIKEDGPGTATWGLVLENTGGSIEAQDGILKFSRGYTQTAGTTFLGFGNLEVTTLDIQGGSLGGAGSIFGNVTNGGEVSPGDFLDINTTGTIAVFGTYTQLASGNLNIDIGGQSGGSEHDRLAISEDAILAGTLNVNAFSITTPTGMEQYQIMTYSSRTGTFDQYNGLDLGNGTTLMPNFTPTALFLETGAAEDLTVTPQFLDFGDVLLGGSATATVTVTNNGPTIVNVDTINLVGPNPEMFQVNQVLLPLILNPGESQDLQVDFTPMFVGEFEAELLVASEAGSTSVQLLGAGVDVLSDPDSLVLVDLYNSTDGPNWTNNTNWLSDQPLTTWFGVEADQDGDVLNLLLSDNALAGTIPASIGSLDELRTLDLSRNQLSGSIPAELGDMIDLTELLVHDNQLSGSIPNEIGNLSNLATLLAANNQLSGEIPANIGNLSGLVNLDLASNQLTGVIPAEIGNLTNLMLLQFDANQLTGPIPVEIGNLVNLQFLFLNNNQLSGPIPAEIGNLTNLVDLFLAANQLSGPIPPELGNLTALGRLTLEVNELTGSIPSELGNLNLLVELALEINQLSGDIPPELANLVSLKILRLWDNGFTGTVPSEVANLDNLEWFGIHDNRLEDLPDLSGLARLDRLEIENNLFTFEDIEPNIGIPGFIYSPQDSVGEERQETLLVGSSLTMSVSVGGANNRYQWLKDGGPIQGAIETSLSLAGVDLADAGVYTCEISNTLATDLTLYRRPVIVNIVPPTPVQVAVPAPPRPNTDQILSITPPGNFQPTLNEMFYRRAGEPSYQVSPLAPSGNEFQGTIPSNFVTIRGLEYYISLSDGQVQVTFPPTDPANNPAILPVQLDRLEYPLLLQPETYKMISLPIQLSNTQIDSVLTDDYGPYDVLPRQWRLFRLENGGYVEYPNFSAALTNGPAFFLITRAGATFDIENGQSANSGQPVVLTIQPGWNQIGNPFAFQVSWSDIVVSGNVQGPVFFDGVEYQFVFGTIEPWEGYFVYNADPTPATLTVPAREAQAASLSAASKFSPATDNEYTLQLIATVPGTHLRDTQNYLGFREDASPSMDQHDLLEPPSIGRHLRLTLVSEGNEFAANFKPHDGLGREWELRISSTLRRPTIQIVLHASRQLGDGHGLFVLDLDHQERISTEEMAFTLQLNRELPVRRLRVMIGTEQFAQQNPDGIPLIPLEFALEQNYPNPFNPTTTIRYRLRKTGAVSMKLFNLLGQEIRTLIDEEQRAGVHTVTWDGTDNNGHTAASGVYIYRLTSAGATATRKLVLMR